MESLFGGVGTNAGYTLPPFPLSLPREGKQFTMRKGLSFWEIANIIRIITLIHFWISFSAAIQIRN